MSEGLKWLSVLWGLLIMVGAGNTTAVAIWNRQLGDELGYSQADISLMSAIGNLGMNCALHLGILHDCAGTRVTAILAAIMQTSGYGLLLVGFQAGCEQPVLMASALALAGQGSCLGIMMTMASNQAIFGKRRVGLMSGLMMCGLGLSGVAVSWLYALAGEVSQFFLLAMCLFGGISACGAVVLQPMPPLPPDEDQTGRTDLLKMFKRLPFWLILSVQFVLDGTYIMWLTNLPYILEETGSDHDAQLAILVACLGSTVGRLGFGYTADQFTLHRSRAFLWVLLCALATGANVCMSLCTSTRAFSMVGVAMGLYNGGSSGLWPVLVRDILGDRNIGSKMGFVVSSSGFGFLCVFGPVFTAFYSRKTHRRDAFLVSAAASIFAFFCALYLALSRGGTSEGNRERSWSGRRAGESCTDLRELPSLQPVEPPWSPLDPHRKANDADPFRWAIPFGCHVRVGAGTESASFASAT